MNRLSYENQWEADIYWVKEGRRKRRVKMLRSVQINGKSYEVISRVVSVPYYDHGHSYYGSSHHFFITETAFGIEMEFDLKKVILAGAEVYAEYYVLEDDQKEVF